LLISHFGGSQTSIKLLLIFHFLETPGLVLVQVILAEQAPLRRTNGRERRC
jgi:hypothetical protein